MDIETAELAVKVQTFFFFFFVFILGLQLSDTKVYEPEIRALLGTASHYCEAAVLKSYMGASLIRNTPPVRPYSSPMPGDHKGVGVSYERGAPVEVRLAAAREGNKLKVIVAFP